LAGPVGLSRHAGTGSPASTIARPINAEVYRFAETLASY
jgi:hypothetical protein